jgi:hypothetical protein
MPYGTVNADVIADSNGGVFAPVSSVFRNRIINGAMVIDQRNAGASVTPTASVYTLDRWRAGVSVTSKFSVQQDAGAVTPPVGFNDYLGATSLSAYTVGASEVFILSQAIEGFNAADLDWGTANAKTVTLSFWVRSSLTGTFGGVFRNSAQDRTYPYTYTITSANTWEYKTVTIVGDTTGTWLKTNGIGIQVIFSLGSGSTASGTAGAWVAGNFTSATGATSVVGTNGATFYITGVQLEVGTQATSFEYRQYQQELALCQRYYYKITPDSTSYPLGSFYVVSTTIGRCQTFFPVNMRVKPTALEQSGTAGDYSISTTSVTTCSAVPTFNNSSVNYAATNMTVASGLTAGQAGEGRGNATGYLAWSAEL